MILPRKPSIASHCRQLQKIAENMRLWDRAGVVDARFDASVCTVEASFGYGRLFRSESARSANETIFGPADRINIGQPFGVELGPDGALYITEVKHHRIRRLDLTSNTLTTVAGCGRRGYSGDGGLAVEAQLHEPYEVRFDSAGHMYIVEMMNHVIRRVDTKTKVISTIAGKGQSGFGGDGGPALDALLNHPHSIALDDHGGLYIADIGNHRIRRIDLANGKIESVAGNAQRILPKDGQKARGNALHSADLPKLVPLVSTACRSLHERMAGVLQFLG